jgi:UDP-glucuronate decarboxylase
MDVERNPEAPVNLGNPGEFTILELAEMVKQAIRSRSRIVYRPLPTDDPQRRRPDISRAKKLLGWAPKVPLADGLPPTIEWFAHDLKLVRNRNGARSARLATSDATLPGGRG